MGAAQIRVYINLFDSFPLIAASPVSIGLSVSRRTSGWIYTGQRLSLLSLLLLLLL